MEPRFILVTLPSLFCLIKPGFYQRGLGRGCSVSTQELFLGKPRAAPSIPAPSEQDGDTSAPSWIWPNHQNLSLSHSCVRVKFFILNLLQFSQTFNNFLHILWCSSSGSPREALFALSGGVTLFPEDSGHGDGDWGLD